jgi:YVTN family beta-propeller protein
MKLRISSLIAAFALAGRLGSTQTVAQNAYITNQSSNTVSVIDTVTNAVTATIPVGVVPEGVAVTPNGSKVYVANDLTAAYR